MCVNGEDALVQLPIHNPKVVLMDITLGGINGIEVVKGTENNLPRDAVHDVYDFEGMKRYLKP